MVIIDPWFTGNPTVPPGINREENLKKTDLVLISHAHVDHVAGLEDILAVNPHVPVVCHMEFGSLLVGEGKKNVHRLNMGGTYSQGDIRVTLVPASHSSSYGLGAERVWAGREMGFILTLGDGYKIYYAGDTGLSADMKIVIGDYFKPDLAILPVSGHVTMDVEQACYAAGKLIKPEAVIPCHYFPEVEKAPDAEKMKEVLEMWPIVGPMVGEMGKELKALIAKRYPHIETIVLELGEGVEINTATTRKNES